MDDRFETKKAELRFLAGEFEKNPKLFEQKSFLEDANTLSEFGIWIPEKDSCPSALLKLWPEDFIVEEIAPDGSVATAGDTPLVDSSDGKTVYATLVKCGVSTIEAVHDVASNLGISPEDISYAGIKDKEAITAQTISLRKTTLEKVSTLHSPHFFLKDVRTGNGVTQKGGLLGNRFTILVRIDQREFTEEKQHLFVKKLEVIKEHGFYNFFYLQRFGTPRLHNFAWAQLILQANYEKAVKDIFTFEGERELAYFKNIRRQLGTLFGKWDDMSRLIEPFPMMFFHEHRLLTHLRAHPGDFVGALQQLPEQISLWMYALSSLLFNQRISNYLIDKQEPPKELPFFLSRDKECIEPYKDMLQQLHIYPPPFQNLKPFPQVLLRSRFVPTKDMVRLRSAELVDEGVIFEFDLMKGQYATTFLSHLFTLVAGKVPDSFPKTRLDTKAALGEVPLQPSIDYFSSVIKPKGQSFLEELGESV